MTRVLVTGGGGQLGREFALLLGSDAVALGREELDVTDEESVARRSRGTARSSSCTAPPGPMWTARSRTRTGPGVRTSTAAATSPAPRMPAGPRSSDSPPITFSRATTLPDTTSTRPSHRAASTGHPSSRASERCSPSTPMRTSCARPGCSRPAARTSCSRCCASAWSGTRWAWSMTRSAVRPRLRTSPHATMELVERCAPGTYHLAGGGSTSWHGFASAIMEAGGSGRPRRADRLERAAAPGPETGLLDPANRPRRRSAAATLERRVA